ncbi:YhfC family intramembrane metalloprotease [Salinicoccus sp. HZC-1]|uniref:YhfC family intramembrane metalloprotease n=1 Tax=Salinicoccus sp. HZC-1 TaxID=3385497 RepID=UPI00398B41EA
MVSTTSIVLMGLAGLFSVLLPFLFIMVLRRKFKIRWIPILIGAATFIIFAMVLEQITHLLVLRPGVDGTIPLIAESPWLYVLYGVLAAGIFEETGRLVAFLLMKKKHKKIDSAISYGIGHGGIEAIIVVGLGMLSSIVFSVMFNNGGSIADELPPGIAESMAGTPNITYVLAIVERIFAISVHIGLSIIVFVSVIRKGKWWLFPLAIVLHALTNLTAAMMQAGLLTNMWIMYAGFIVMTLITLWIAYNIGVKKIQVNFR